MTRPSTSSRPAPGRHRRIRTAAAITAIAALTATGSYLATATIGPDTAPPTPATDVNPSAQTLRDMLQSIAGQHGNRSAASADVNPSTQVQRELRQSIAGQYGSRPAAGVVNPSTRVRHELRDSVAGQYGPAR